MMNRMGAAALSIAMTAAMASAAVVVDGTSTSGALSWTHTVKAGDDAVLAVCPGGGAYNADLAASDADVTYTIGDSDTIHTTTKAVYEYGDVGPGQEYHGIYYATLGDVGAEMDVTITIDFKADTGRDAHSALNLYGVSQSAPVGQAGAVFGGQSSLKVDLTGCQSGSLVLTSAHVHYNGTLVPEEAISEIIPSTEYGSARCAAGTIDVASGDVTANWTRNGGNRMGVAAVEFVPEPTTMGLLALGGLAMIRRRRA